MKRKRKPATRPNYQEFWKRAEWVKDELEKKLRRANDEIVAAQRRYEEAFPQTVELYHEVQALRAQMESYKKRLASMLTDQQREAAKITGCDEDEYAIQLIRLCRQKIEEISRLVPY
jgi:predicted  nucleic acid-binding Zn-ribbon protein